MEKKKMKTSNVVLIVIAIILILFTITNLILFAKIGAVPDVLITSVFAACLGEFSVLGVIKTSKIKHGADDIDDEICNEEEE